MRHLDLFSGIGGFSLAASWVFPNHDILGFCEIDEFCHRVLRKHWPDVPIHDDIKQLDGGLFENVDLLTGGFPCQPYSVAGLQRGAKDNRALWPEMLRVIREARPRWVVGENVIGFVNMGFEQTAIDLEEIGYEVQSFVIPAVAVGAQHRRDRIWIVAHTDSERRATNVTPGSDEKSGSVGGVSLAEVSRGLYKPDMVREVHGIPGGLDRLRIKSLGNAIVPQVAARIFQAIQRIESDPNL